MLPNLADASRPLFGLAVPFWIGLLVLHLGCAGTRVESDTAEGVTFKETTPYAWMDPEPGDESRDEVLDLRVRQAVDTELAATGWQLVEPGQAEVLLSGRTGIEERIEYRDPYYDAFVAEKVEEGTITLWVFDARSKARLWRGSGSARLRKVARAVGLNQHQYAEVPEEERHWPVQILVRDILAELPLD